MTDEQEKKGSIWDGLPEEWLTTEPDAPLAPTVSEHKEKEVQREKQKKTELEKDRTVEPPKKESQSSNPQPAEKSHKERKEHKKPVEKKHRIDRAKYREFEAKLKENRYNSSEKARIAYQKEEKENKKDFIILAATLIVVILGIIAVVSVFTRSSNQRIYDLIEQGNFSTAYHSIEERYTEGKNVDSMVYEFISSCLDREEYKRAVAALDMLSDDAEHQIEFFRNLVKDLIAHNKTNRAKDVIGFMQKRGGALAEQANELLLNEEF